MFEKPLLLLTFTLATATFTLGIREVAGQPPEARQAPAEEPLLALMEGMKAHLKGTAMALADESGRDAALMHVAELQRYALLAKLRDPANLKDLPEEQRDGHRTAFRRDLALALAALVDLELLILDGDLAGARELVKGRLLALREAAHSKYQPN